MHPPRLPRHAAPFCWRIRAGFGLLLLVVSLAQAAAGVPDGCTFVSGRWGAGPPREVVAWSGGGEHLLLVGAGADVVLLDATDAAAPVRLGSITLEHAIERIAISPDGQLASASDGFERLSLIDLGDRAAPQQRGNFAWPGLGQPHGMAFDGAGHLFVAVRSVGLAVLDIADPNAPQHLGFSDGPVTDYVFDVALRGGHAYLAQRDDGVQVVDISDPADPRVVGSHAASAGAASIRIAGNRAFVGGSQGVTILGLADPVAPVLLGSVDPGYAYAAQPLPGNRMLVSSEGVRLYDVSTPSAPVEIGAWASPNTYRIATRGSVAWVTRPGGHDRFLRGIDFSVPTAPVETTGIEFTSGNLHTSVGVGHVLVAAGDSGVVMLDTADPARPTQVARLPLSHNAQRVVHVNGHAVVGAGIDPWISVIDPQPTGPVQVASLDTGHSTNWLASEGSRLYIAQAEGLGIYDMANPLVPQLLGRYAFSGSWIVRVAVAEGIAYGGEPNSQTLRVVDVSDPAAPMQIGSYTLPDDMTTIDATGDIVYAATYTGGVRILRHDGGGQLTEVGVIDVPLSIVSGVSIDGDRLHLAAGVMSGLLIYDITDPEHPVLLEQHNTAGEAMNVDAAHGVIALSEGNSGVSTFGCDTSAHNSAPQPVGVIGTQQSIAGETIFPLSVHANFSDPEGQALGYAAEGLPPGLALGAGNGIVTGTLPPGSQGSYTVAITASDPFGLAATQTFAWQVHAAQTPDIFGDGFE